jgi:hypothetical protein
MSEDKIKQLLARAEKQGYLTYDEIKGTFPEGTVSPEELDKIHLDLLFEGVQIIERGPGKETGGLN